MFREENYAVIVDDKVCSLIPECTYMIITENAEGNAIFLGTSQESHKFKIPIFQSSELKEGTIKIKSIHGPLAQSG